MLQHVPLDDSLGKKAQGRAIECLYTIHKIKLIPEFKNQLYMKKIHKLTAHSFINSSHWVREDKTVKNWSQSSVETTTFRFALIHVTINVCKNKKKIIIQ